MRARALTLDPQRCIRWTFSAAVLVLLVALTACGSSTRGRKIYVVGLGTSQVQIFDASSSGSLTANTTNLTGTGSRPDAILLTRHFAYVLNSAGGLQPGAISEYAVGGSGTLSVASTTTALSTTTVSATPPNTGLNPVAMVMDSAGKFVFVANQGSNSISVFSVDAGSGLLTEITGSPFTTAAGPSGLATTANLLFVANQAAGVVSVHTFDQSGKLTQVSGAPVPAGTSPTALDLDSGGKFLFVADQASNSVLAFGISGSSGQLSAIAGSPFPAGTTPVHVRVAGSSVYIANAGSGNVSAYSITSGSGALTAISGSPFSVGANPVYITSADSGKLLLVANQESNNISVLQVGGGGALTAASGSPFATVVASPSAIASNF